ncbi:NeuD/PglB/VioB family sugar acetyltransferase [Sediminicola arcticus]|uniref:NeuD/PglB/VioB family sugar acetyltransferase n=1 Tax=Sediminicola arcticus TaxID=1574308 RepID=A0ABV2SXM3_9FLAO
MDKTINTSVIVGAGTQGQVYASYIIEAGINLIGFIDDDESLKDQLVMGLPVLGKFEDLLSKDFKSRIANVYCPIGDNQVRVKYLSQLKKEGYKTPSFIHRTVSIAPDVILGEAVYMLAGNIVMPHTKIGNYLMINMGSTIAHHVHISDGVFMSSGVNLGALINVGENAYFGMGSTIMTGVKTVGKEALIGAGTVIIKDVPENAVMVGNPGRILRFKQSTKAIQKPFYDIAFIGSGISSSFTILHFLEGLKEKKPAKPIKIALIEKNKEFFTGIPYGNRSGSSSLLITSLADFLPEPELGKFIPWLNENKVWLIDEFKKDGGILTEKWISLNREAIEKGAWKDLFIPRWFFGKYINDKVSRALEDARISGAITYELISMQVDNVIATDENYKIIGEKNTVLTRKVVLGIGSPPPRRIWEPKREITDDESKLLLISNPYYPSLDETLEKISTFLDKRKGLKTNVLLVGANASALEMLYKQNDSNHFNEKINKFIFLSTHGLTPNSEIDQELGKKFKPSHLIALKKVKELKAKHIAEACFSDLGVAEKLGLDAATTVKPISKAFGELLSHLNEEELRNFACVYGNEIGRRQRCAGVHYTNTIIDLKKSGKFEHIAGGFEEITNSNEFEYSFQYTNTLTQNKETYEDAIHIIINCIGSTSLTSNDLPILYKNLITSGLCEQNKSMKGFKVNTKLEANAKGFYIIGPLLAGNVIEKKPVWHLEHCGRIIWSSKILATSLLQEFGLMDEKIIQK